MLHLDSSTIEAIILIGNVIVAVMNNVIRNKVNDIKNQIEISALKQEAKINSFEAKMYQTFLTKDDFYSTHKTEH